MKFEVMSERKRVDRVEEMAVDELARLLWELQEDEAAKRGMLIAFE